MGDEVRTAVNHRFQACLPPLALRPDRLDYVRVPADNLLPVIEELILDDFASGDGGDVG